MTALVTPVSIRENPRYRRRVRYSDNSPGDERNIFNIVEDSVLEQKERPLPERHRFFWDCERETNARVIEWLNEKSDLSWFQTMTFTNEISQHRALARLNQFMGRLSEAYRCKGGRRLTHVTASEWQQRNVIHFHSLVCGVGLDDLPRKRWEHRWESVRGNGYCRIYNAEYAAAPYLAKYTSKTRGGELHWGGTWRGLNIPGSVSCCQSRLVGDLGSTTDDYLDSLKNASVIKKPAPN